MEKSFDKLSKIILKEWNWKTIYYLANPWNFGDWLIREWTLKFFNDYNIKYKEISSTLFRLKYFFIKKNSLFIYWWGWWWCKNWNHALYFVKMISKKCKTIVLPSTFENNYEDITNTIFFRRDKYNSRINMPNSIFCHDMAFYLWKIESTIKKRKKNGYFYRTDKESANKIKIPKNNLDISLLWSEKNNINIFINEIDKYNIIYTDRLHVWIAWILLWKEVHLYWWNYFKINDIYKSSIKPNFKNIFFEKYE